MCEKEIYLGRRKETVSEENIMRDRRQMQGVE